METTPPKHPNLYCSPPSPSFDPPIIRHRPPPFYHYHSSFVLWAHARLIPPPSPFITSNPVFSCFALDDLVSPFLQKGSLAGLIFVIMLVVTALDLLPRALAAMVTPALAFLLRLYFVLLFLSIPFLLSLYVISPISLLLLLPFLNTPCCSP